MGFSTLQFYSATFTSSSGLLDAAFTSIQWISPSVLCLSFCFVSSSFLMSIQLLLALASVLSFSHILLLLAIVFSSFSFHSTTITVWFASFSFACHSFSTSICFFFLLFAIILLCVVFRLPFSYFLTLSICFTFGLSSILLLLAAILLVVAFCFDFVICSYNTSITALSFCFAIFSF